MQEFNSTSLDVLSSAAEAVVLNAYSHRDTPTEWVYILNTV